MNLTTASNTLNDDSDLRKQCRRNPGWAVNGHGCL